MAIDIDGLIEAVGPRVVLQIGPANGKAVTPVSFLVDTAASRTHISPAVLDGIGLKPTGGEGTIRRPNRVEIKGSKYTISLWAGAVCLYPSLEVITTTPEGASGLIGQDVLSDCIMTHDGPAKNVRLHFPKVNPPEG